MEGLKSKYTDGGYHIRFAEGPTLGDPQILVAYRRLGARKLATRVEPHEMHQALVSEERGVNSGIGSS
jgi:hypothetical protein